MQVEEILSNIGAIPLLFWATAFLTTLGAMAVKVEMYLPGFVIKLFKYGKTAPKALEKTPLDIQVPKKWFAHFYVFATAYMAFVVFTVLVTYLAEQTFPGWYRHLLELLLPEAKVTVSPSVIMLATFLFLMQVSRRLYECYFISIFSPATMSVFHYAVGFAHYFGSSTSLLTQAPTHFRGNLSLSEISPTAWVGTAIFIWAWYQQYAAALGLANLRKKKDGSISHEHRMPQGGLFELVSCPHYYAEVLIYSSMYLIVGFGNFAWLAVLAWVVSNQTISALMCHEWYQKKFKSYPKNRKAIYPFVL